MISVVEEMDKKVKMDRCACDNAALGAWP